jgi:hypothetical protein
LGRFTKVLLNNPQLRSRESSISKTGNCR